MLEEFENKNKTSPIEINERTNSAESKIEESKEAEEEKEKIDIKITKKETLELHTESFHKIFNIRDKKVPFAHQKTLANCGPLAIVNGLNALKGINSKFKSPKEFPLSSGGIRKLLLNDQALRTEVLGIRIATDEIAKDDYAIDAQHIANIIKKLASESNIQIIGDRFTALSGFKTSEIKEKISNADWLICHKGYHFTSFVRFDDTDWVSLDSMNNQPIVVNQKFIEDNYKDISFLDPAFFMALKVTDKIVIIKKKQ